MAITTKESILKALSAYNPWWKTGTVSPQMSKTYKRFAFHEAMKRLTDKGIRRSVVLTGTRRVGKTTIQYQSAVKVRCGTAENCFYFFGSSYAEAQPISGCAGVLS